MKTSKFFRIMCIIKKCKERGLWGVAIAIHKKYNIPQVNESHYD
mgnify:FL=1|jgi:hypothetical protein|tara:strand:- start:523 stop:654 length:132 start_codon:yes stop_codon:yes gene_type:complete